MKKTIFERLSESEPLSMADPDFKPAVEEMGRKRLLCQKLNRDWDGMSSEEIRKAFAEILRAPLEEGSSILLPVQLDFGNQMRIGKHVFINHSFTASGAAGICIEDNVQIAPNVTVLTVNHNMDNRMIVVCRPVHIGKGAWIGANATILPGVTIGANAVVGAAAVVTKDVPADTVVAGNPARIIRTLAAQNE